MSSDTTLVVSEEDAVEYARLMLEVSRAQAKADHAKTTFNIFFVEFSSRYGFKPGDSIDTDARTITRAAKVPSIP